MENQQVVGKTLAEELHRLADSEKMKNVEMIINEIVLLATDRAKTVAETGNYHCSFYDERLIDTLIASGAKKRLEHLGFNVEINVDKSLSKVSEKTMIRIELDW